MTGVVDVRPCAICNARLAPAPHESLFRFCDACLANTDLVTEAPYAWRVVREGPKAGQRWLVSTDVDLPAPTRAADAAASGSSMTDGGTPAAQADAWRKRRNREASRREEAVERR